MKITDLGRALELSGKLDGLVRFEKFVESKAAKEYFQGRFYDFDMEKNHLLDISRDEVKELIRREKATIEKMLAELEVEL